MDIYGFIHKNGYKALQGRQIDVCGEKCFIHERFFTPGQIPGHTDIGYRIRQGREPYSRLYGGETQNADLVRRIYPTYEVINE